MARDDETPLCEMPTCPPGPLAEQATLTAPTTHAGACVAPSAPPGHEILGELGRGGMGVVYKARQAKLGRVVALKMILGGGHVGAEGLARFRTEAEAIARLQHPNIVQIFEVGDHEGLPYFALEYCPGGSLDRKLAGTPMPADEAAALTATLARAVDAAHVKGIVHRDLKPQNILLDEAGRPKVTDFGIAKKIGDDSGQTAAGSIMGTPSYMSPEQADGKPVGTATDIYALGAILYEMLTGRPPFKAATPLDTILQVVHGDPVPPRRLQPALPADLETICLKCLAKEPGRRYATAAGLADDLERYCAGEPIEARPEGVAGRVLRWCRRRPLLASSLALAALLMITSVASLRASLVGVDALARRNQRLLAEGLAGRLDERLRGDTLAVGALARLSEARALLAAPGEGRAALLPAANEALAALVRANEDISAAFLLDRDGVAVASTNPAHPGRSYAFRAYFREAAAGKVYRSHILVGTSTGKPGMYGSAPVYGPGGALLGVAVVKVEAEALWGIVDALGVADGDAVFVLDQDGVVVAHQDRARLFHAVAALDAETARTRFRADAVPTLGTPGLEAVVGAKSSGELSYTRPEDGARRAVAYAPMRGERWSVVIDVDGRQYDGPGHLRLWRDLQIGALVCLGLVALLIPAWRWLRGE